MDAFITPGPPKMLPRARSGSPTSPRAAPERAQPPIQGTLGTPRGPEKPVFSLKKRLKFHFRRVSEIDTPPAPPLGLLGSPLWPQHPPPYTPKLRRMSRYYLPHRPARASPGVGGYEMACGHCRRPRKKDRGIELGSSFLHLKIVELS